MGWLMKRIKNFWEKRTQVYGERAATYASRNRIGDFFKNAFMTLFHAWILRRVLRLCKPVSVLEVGCGSGRLLSKVDVSFSVGIDVSLNMLTLLKAKGGNNNVVLADTRYLPFKIESFDLTYSCTVLEHIPNDGIGSAVGEIQKVTRNYVFIIEPLPTFKHINKPYSQGGHCFPHDYRKLFDSPILWNVKLPWILSQEAILFRKRE